LLSSSIACGLTKPTSIFQRRQLPSKGPPNNEGERDQAIPLSTEYERPCKGCPRTDDVEGKADGHLGGAKQQLRIRGGSPSSTPIASYDDQSADHEQKHAPSEADPCKALVTNRRMTEGVHHGGGSDLHRPTISDNRGLTTPDLPTMKN
jgi:hypothetical protein